MEGEQSAIGRRMALREIAEWGQEAGHLERGKA